METGRIGIIGGSGLYDIQGIDIKENLHVDTPFGEPSDNLLVGAISGKEVVFLPRHGKGHRLLPSEINCRANIWAMKKLGVQWIISISAVGSLKQEIKPLDIVIIDQFFDRTRRRIDTFFGQGAAAHVMFANPTCENLRKVLYQVVQDKAPGVTVHWGGTYINIEGPAFSTKAESNVYRSWDMDVIGMTNLTEAKCAREAEICYATLAMVTDYDCWIDDDQATVNVEMILKNLRQNIRVAKTLIKDAIPHIPADRNCECATALKNAVMTRGDLIPEQTRDKLDLLLQKHLK